MINTAEDLWRHLSVLDSVPVEAGRFVRAIPSRTGLRRFVVVAFTKVKRNKRHPSEVFEWMPCFAYIQIWLPSLRMSTPFGDDLMWSDLRIQQLCDSFVERKWINIGSEDTLEDAIHKEFGGVMSTCNCFGFIEPGCIFEMHAWA